jgi:transposase
VVLGVGAGCAGAVAQATTPARDGAVGEALDAGTVKVFIEADAPRVRCAEHGVVVAHVPWARHGAGHTLAFDQSVAWLVTQCSKTAVTQLMRIAWRTVCAIIARVWADVEALGDRLDGLTRIGIDEISYKRGHRYLTVVVDHDSGRLPWAAPGRDRATLRGFFDLLGAERSAAITHVSADQADWIAEIVAERCPNPSASARPGARTACCSRVQCNGLRQALGAPARPLRTQSSAVAHSSGKSIGH